MRGSRPDGWSRIGNFHISCTCVRTKTDRCPDVDIWIAILVLRWRASGRDTTSSWRLIDLSFIGTWKESETGRVPRGVRTCCWNVRTNASCIETSWLSGGSGRKCTSSGRYGTSYGRMEQWSDGRPDGMARSSGRLTGNRNLHSAKSSKSALNSEIPVYSIFTHTNNFVQTQNEAKKLTNSPFGHSGTKITWPVKNTIPVQINNYSPFLSQRDKG
jgi:hypothetical protein